MSELLSSPVTWSPGLVFWFLGPPASNVHPGDILLDAFVSLCRCSCPRLLRLTTAAVPKLHSLRSQHCTTQSAQDDTPTTWSAAPAAMDGIAIPGVQPILRIG